MTKRLILIRHAKSGWDDVFADDHARTLTERGRVSATAIGNWLANAGYTPDLLIYSDAARTAETTDLIIARQPVPQVRPAAVLYHGAPDTIIDMIRQEKAATIAIVGHNPGIGMAAHMLVRAAPNHPRFDDYPTCATTVIDFEIDTWADLQRHQGACVDFVVPRDLIGATGPDIE